LHLDVIRDFSRVGRTPRFGEGLDHGKDVDDSCQKERQMHLTVSLDRVDDPVELPTNLGSPVELGQKLTSHDLEL
jgi:hypothetical protein